MNDLLNTKNAIIYGGGGTIGRVVAKTFAAEGATVFLAGRTRETLEAAAAEVAADGGTAHVAIVDALDEAAVEAHLRSVVEQAGSVDVSFNLVTRGDVQGTPLLDMNVDDFMQPIVNGARSNFITARAAGRQMVKQGNGSILMITSGSGAVLKTSPQFQMGGTGPADAATESFLHYLAGELGPSGVRVNGLWTAGVSLPDLMKNLSLMGEGPTAQQFADAAAFVASERGNGITASIVNATIQPRRQRPLSTMADFAAQTAQHRRELHVHCYRMLGSFDEAEDAVQETLLRAWKARDRFDPEAGAGLRAWLYAIATNTCLDAIKAKGRRVTTMTSFAEVPWLQPYPDQLLDELADPAEGPDAVVVARETIELAYLALIQLLPARQRAVLLLRDVLDWSAAETAAALELSVPAANSALQRARETVKQHSADRLAEAPDAATDVERQLLDQFISCHERGDIDGSLALLREDIRVTMPPNPWLFEGLDEITGLMRSAFADERFVDWRVRPVWANRMPAALGYALLQGDTVYRAFKIDVLRIEGDKIREITTFDGRLHGMFGMPGELTDP